MEGDHRFLALRNESDVHLVQAGPRTPGSFWVLGLYGVTFVIFAFAHMKRALSEIITRNPRN